MTARYTKKHREACVIFLDDNFDAEGVPQCLLEAGFCSIETFTKSFPREDKPDVRTQDVKDAKVLRLCNTNGWLLVTTDSNMRETHAETIKTMENLAILATAHNKVNDIFEWANALCKCKSKIEKLFKKQERPWFAKFDRSGRITSCQTVPLTASTRRVRPQEHEALSNPEVNL